MASLQQQKRNAEGHAHIKEAEKHMKTSFFKWKPDLDSAASEYGKAAICFRNAKSFNEAKDALIKAAEIQIQMNATFHAAKSYEQAGLLCKEYKEIEGCVNLLERAADLFHQNGTPDTASLTLDKAARAIEMDYPLKASQLYQKACDISELEDKSRQCAEFSGKAGRLLIKAGKYDEALQTLMKELEFHQATQNYAMINRLIVGIVLVHLHSEDPVGAERFYQNMISSMGGTLEGTEESGIVSELLLAYNDGDEEMARQVLNRPYVKYMDNCYAKIAQRLEIPGGVGGRGGKGDGGIPTVPIEELTSDVSSKAQIDDDDEGLL